MLGKRGGLRAQVSIPDYVISFCPELFYGSLLLLDKATFRKSTRPPHGIISGETCSSDLSYIILRTPNSQDLLVSFFFPFLPQLYWDIIDIKHCLNLKCRMGFPSDSVLKNSPAKQETQVQSLGWKDPLEKETAAHSSILARRIPWTEEPGGLQSMGSQRVGYNLVTKQQ